jgi:hypothetical protein
MLPPLDRNDEAAFDAMAAATLNWMRFFASLRMTASAGGATRVAHTGKIPATIRV